MRKLKATWKKRTEMTLGERVEEKKRGDFPCLPFKSWVMGL